MERSLKTNNESVVLMGPDGSYTPFAVPPEERDVQALKLFQSFLCNSDHERSSLSNVIMLWEQIPKFSAEFLNSSKQESLPNDFVKEFKIGDQLFTLRLFPGTYDPSKTKGEAPKRRFPGIREQAVEQALIQLATAQAEAYELDGETRYCVRFSIRELAKVLKFLGPSYSHGQIRESLEVLSSTTMTLTKKGDQVYQSRNAIVPSFERNGDKSDARSYRDTWSVQLHPLVSHAIRNVTYRQYPISHTNGLKNFGSYLVRLMHYAAPNIAQDRPYTFTLLQLRNLTPGLDQKTVTSSINVLRRELDKLVDGGLITHFDMEKVFPKRKPAGRPSPIDAAFALYPTKDWIQHVKAGSRRMTETEQSLNLPRSSRADRQIHLPLL